MIAWIRENAVLFSIATGLVVCISTVAVDRYRLSGLFAAQPATHQHINDTTRHLDPQRDAEADRQLLERIERLERRLDRCERVQIWMATSIRANNTSSIPLLSDRRNVP